VLFFIELGTRQVRLAGVTRHPKGPWIVRRARELSMERPEGMTIPRFLIRGRDSKLTRAFVSGSSTSICGTTTTSDRIEAFSFARRAAATSDYATSSVVAVADRVRRRNRFRGLVTSITRSRHDVRVSESNGRN
jgi:hypothetical protein